MAPKQETLESKITKPAMSILEAELIAGTIVLGIYPLGRIACTFNPEYKAFGEFFDTLVYAGVAWNVGAVLLNEAFKPRNYEK